MDLCICVLFFSTISIDLSTVLVPLHHKKAKYDVLCSKLIIFYIHTFHIYIDQLFTYRQNTKNLELDAKTEFEYWILLVWYVYFFAVPFCLASSTLFAYSCSWNVKRYEWEFYIYRILTFSEVQCRAEKLKLT